MMNIVQWPNDVLTQECEHVIEVTDHIRKLAAAMIETMRLHRGIGLAAPQVGVPLRVIVGEGPGWSFALANPELIKVSSQTMTNQEGCLSFEGMGEVGVVRPKQVKVGGYDMRGDYRVFKARGLLAACLQHEIDHLNGVTLNEYGLGDEEVHI